MTDNADIVTDLLGQFAVARGVPADASPQDIITSSLDQMRFLVGLEERLEVMLDIGDVLPFDLTSRDAFMKSVQSLLADADVTL